MHGAGFSFTAMSKKALTQQLGSSAADTQARFKAIERSRTHPRGSEDSWLEETIAHAEDVQKPLGIGRGHPFDSVARVADFNSRSNLLIGGKRRVTGETLLAADTDWRHEHGPEIEGSVLALLLTIAGRTSALRERSGDGSR